MFKSLLDSGEWEYRVKVKKWLSWRTEFKSTDAEKARVIYNRLLRSPNIKKG